MGTGERRYNPKCGNKSDTTKSSTALSMTTNSHLSLLDSFDAAREFIRAMWEQDAQQCGDLAQLLGSMNRSEIDGRPLDIAQWSDWLDAAASVRPDLVQIKVARHKMQEDHKEFARLCAIKEPELQREMMARYRAKRLGQPWHCGGDEVVSVSDGYKIMLRFVRSYSERGGREAACFVDKLDNELELSKDLPKGKGWDDWLRA
jgi:hypothetical protein